MQIDFHYHIAYAIAKEAKYGDEECKIIAYASQFTDDNTTRTYVVKKRDKYDFLIPFPHTIEDNGKRFHPVITQDITLESKDVKTQRYVYAPFHFLPIGNDGSENIYSIKGKKNRYCTIANSANARALMSDAVKSKDLYRIGIAMHTFADTFSHERFTAFEEKWNEAKVSGLSIKRIIPSIGHAQILHTPDIISHDWQDKRFKGTEQESVDNRTRALAAIKALFEFLGPSEKWSSVKSKFEAMVYVKDDAARKEHIHKAYPDCPKYDKDRWFNDALEVRISEDEVPMHEDPLVVWTPKQPRFHEIKFKDGFDESDWCKFHKAAKAQITWVLQQVPIL